MIRKIIIWMENDLNFVGSFVFLSGLLTGLIISNI